MKVYIAGPMRGIEYYNFPAFDAASDTIQRHGLDPISPADLDRDQGIHALDMPPDTDWSVLPDGVAIEAVLQRDMMALSQCQAIYLLDGWGESVGAFAEYACSKMLKIPRVDEYGREYVEPPVAEKRQRVYGGFTANMIGTTQQAAGLLTQMYANGGMTIDEHGKVELADWFAPLFLGVAVKGNRIASGNYHKDNFVDMDAYVGQSEGMQKGGGA